MSERITRRKTGETRKDPFTGFDCNIWSLERGDEVVGIDNLNDYYDPALKKARLARTTEKSGFTDIRIDLEGLERWACVEHAGQGGRYRQLAPQAHRRTNHRAGDAC